VNPIHIGAVDLNLLAVAAALYRHRNASRAAVALGVSQSAVSHALARLRRAFGDPMFVRAARGLVATDFARRIEPELVDLVRRSEALFRREPAFDAARAEGRVTLASTDYLDAVVMPYLLERVRARAPGVQVSLRPTQSELPKRDLEDGRVDLAVAGFYRDLPEGFFQARLFVDEFAVAVRKDHPRVGKTLDRDTYFELEHALITLQGDFADRAAEGSGKTRRARAIRYGSYSFTGLAWVLERSDLVLTAPRRLLERYAEHFAIRILPAPVTIAKVDLRMVWHAQTHEDPLRAWFREQLAATCAQSRP
jgi:DNA-binding transcriptional LysR family regulator